MKSVCEKHQQAYEVGERCPWCEFPAGEPEAVHVAEDGTITFLAPIFIPKRHGFQGLMIGVDDKPTSTATAAGPWPGGYWIGSSMPCPNLRNHDLGDGCMVCGWVRT